MCHSVDLDKKILRIAIREEIQRMPPDYIRLSDRGIRDALLALREWEWAHTVFVYVSMGREPETGEIIQAALEAGKTVAVPRCLEEGVMEARVIPSVYGLRPGRFGSLEPDETASLLDPSLIDLVVAPCLAADRHGYRLGHGGGYYDRYLAMTRGTVVCLCRDRLLQADVPHDAFDIPADIVVTEQECFDNR